MAGFMMKTMMGGNPLDKVPGVGGDDKKEDTEEDEEARAQLAEQRRIEEEKRIDKYRKMEAEREDTRQGIRDKYRLKKKEDPFAPNPNALGRPRGAPGEEESNLPQLPGNMNEHLGKAGAMASELGGKATDALNGAKEQCSIQ